MADEKPIDDKPTWEETMDATAAAIDARDDNQEAEDAPVEEEAETEEVVASEAETEDAPATEEVEETTSDQREDEAVEAATEADPEPSVEPSPDVPASWSPAIKDEWEKLPGAIQETILKREGDFQKGLQQYAERSKAYEQVETVLEPVKQALQLSGRTPTQYIGALVAADQLLQSNPVQGLKYVAQAYNIPLDQLSPAADTQEYQDPQLTAALSRIDGVESLVKQQLTMTEQQQVAALQTQIDTFAADPKHPHFERVKTTMGISMKAAEANGQTMTMDQAYENAVWADPELRTDFQAQQSQAAEDERKKANAKKVAQAKRAGSVNVSSSGHGKGSNPRNETMDQTADRIAAEIAARV